MTPKFALTSTNRPEAEKAKTDILTKYETVPFEEAEYLIALGGDGLMLHSLHENLKKQRCDIATFGMNLGTLGFLTNPYYLEDLPKRLQKTSQTILHPLKMIATDKNGKKHEAIAINEVSILRQSAQTAKLRISVDSQIRMQELICDGILLSTPAGSTAYNFSAHGQIIPLESNLLALTPISAFRPRRWRGALLSNTAEVSIDILHSHKRPVNVVADHVAFHDIVHVHISQDNHYELKVLFDSDYNFEERILHEQFQS